MSDQEPTVDEQPWPDHCPTCGTKLQSAQRGFNPSGDDDIAHGEMDEVVAVDFCPNADCPESPDMDADRPPAAERPQP